MIPSRELRARREALEARRESLRTNADLEAVCKDFGIIHASLERLKGDTHFSCAMLACIDEHVVGIAGRGRLPIDAINQALIAVGESYEAMAQATDAYLRSLS